tara:strand:- start:330 stop:1016 length:687 start_codon:yes stop_codon:yes gene_type:complete
MSNFIINSYLSSAEWDVNWNFDESNLEAYWDTHFPSTDETNLDVNTTTDKIDWKMINDNNDQTMYNDLLGENVNNSKWLLRMKLRFSDVDSSKACQGYIGISSITGASSSSQDFIGVAILTSDNQIRSIDADGSAISIDGDESDSITWANNTDYYLEIIRSSPTAYSCEIFSQSDFTSSVAKVDGTAPSSIQDLRYVKLQNRITGNDGEPVLAIDFIRFENNAVLPPE